MVTEALLAAIREEMERTPLQESQAAPPRIGELHLLAALRGSFVTAELIEEAAGMGEKAADLERGLAALLEESHADLRSRKGGAPAWELEEAARGEYLTSFFDRWGRDPERFRAELERRLPSPEAAKDTVHRMFSCYVRLKSPAVADQNAEELAASQRIVEWVKDFLPGLPSAEMIRTARRYGELLAPFRLLAQHFRGRVKELRQLREYVEWLPAQTLGSNILRGVRQFLDMTEKPPMVLHGVGGAGKTTLMAKFILDHLDYNKGLPLPFIYIDFDQTSVSLREPLTLMMEGARQLALQFPESERALEELRSRWRASLREIARDFRSQRQAGHPNRDANRGSYVSSHDDERGDYATEFANLWTQIMPPESPLLLVLDSFEEAQSRTSALLPDLFSVLQHWSTQIPRLRVVIGGRAEVTEFPAEHVQLEELDIEAAVGFLQSHGIEDESLARYVANRFDRHPLTLQLAAAVAVREGAAAREILGEVRVRNLFLMRVDALRVQQELFRRNLVHLHDREAEKLAMPGLVVRRISPEVIEGVLAGPCQLGSVTLEDAQVLFDKLKTEVSLVVQAGESNAVRYRTDLRRSLLPLIVAEEPERTRQIHDAAVKFYAAAGDEPSARAEEIYHRLSRGDLPEVVESRILPGVEQFLNGALSELPASAHIFLATRFGWSVPAEVKAQVELSAWEEAEVNDLLGAFSSGARSTLESSARRLGVRVDRTDRSPLYRLEAILFERLGRFPEALRSAEIALAVAETKGEEREVWALLMTSARLAQRVADWAQARSHLRRAMSIGVRLKNWDWAARAGVELMRADVRVPGKFPHRVFHQAASRFLNTNDSSENPRGDIVFSLAAGSEDSEHFRSICKAPEKWRDQCLSSDTFQATVATLIEVAGDDERLGKLTVDVFKLRFRQIGRLAGEIQVKAFDVVHFAETAFSIGRLRAFFLSMPTALTSPVPGKNRNLSAAVLPHGAKDKDYFCMAPSMHSIPSAESHGAKAALLQGVMWPVGSRITVKFLEGSPALHQRVKKVASRWTAIANLRFDFRNSGDADIRIAFRPGRASWSYLGTVARSIPPNQPTMNFGWLTDASTDDEVNRVVLHEFGHALGLTHEHIKPTTAIRWNRDAVISDLSGPPHNWDLAEIENKLFNIHSLPEPEGVVLDPDSIMMYPIPSSWTLDGFSAGWNPDISAMDEQIIRRAYPW